MAQKQKKILIIAGLIFLCLAFYLAHGLIAKAQTSCSAKGEACSDSNSCCNTSDRCLAFGDSIIKKCCDAIPGESYLHGFNTCCGYEYLFIGTPNEWRCVKNKTGEFALGDYCTESAQCASKNCCGNKCVDSGPSVPPQCPNNTCFQVGEGCIVSDIIDNCCSPYRCGSNGVCSAVPLGCKYTNDTCNINGDCCSPNVCANDTSSGTNKFICKACKSANDVCSVNSECCSPNVCSNYSCQACKSLAAPCNNNNECCSGNCPATSKMILNPLYISSTTTPNIPQYVSTSTPSTCALALPSPDPGTIPYNPPSAGITISYPNGGENWQVGQTYEIKWLVQVPTSKLEIIIWNYNYPEQSTPQAYKIIAQNLQTSGSGSQVGIPGTHIWTIPDNFFAMYGWNQTDKFKIIITEKRTDSLPGFQDSSDGYFNVVLAPVPVKQCSDCGNGVFNLCDKDECFAIDSHCTFNSTIIGGTCSSNGCATDQECNAIIGCGSEYISKCDTQKRSCSCIPAVTEQKIPFKVTVNDGTGPGSQAIPQATVKVFDNQLQQVGSCVTDQNGLCATNELIPIGYGSVTFPMKSYSTQVSAQGFFTNSTVSFNATLNMPPVSMALYRDSQTTFKATIDLYNHYDEITSGGVIEKIYPFWGVHVGISKKGENTTLQECFAINPPQKCAFNLSAGQYTVFVIDYQFCGVGEGCFTDFEISNGDVVVKLVTKMQKVPMSPSPWCSRTDGGDAYTKGVIRYLTSAAGGYNSVEYKIDQCEGNAVQQYNCSGWPVATACPAGCYDGACLIDCSKMSFSLGGFCAQESQLTTVCGADEIKSNPLAGSFCNNQGGNFCVVCSKACQAETAGTDCNYLNCPYNQTKVSEAACGTDGKCFCRNLSCTQDSNCANISCASDQTKICDVKSYSGASPILIKECFCLNNTSQKRILVHADDNFTNDDLPGILVSILDKGTEVANCVTSDPLGKCTIPALTFSSAHDYTAVIRGVPGYKDAEISLVSRSNADYVSANFHLLSSDPSVITCLQNNDCANFPCSIGQNPTCYNDRCMCQSGAPVIGCSTNNDCISLCSTPPGTKQVCIDSFCGCPFPIVDNTKDTTISITANGGNVAMIIPKGTFQVNVKAEIKAISSNSGNLSGKIALLSASGKILIGSQVFDFSIKDVNGNEIHTFDKPITIQIPYTDEQIKGINESSLKIYIFNEQTNQWDVLPTTVDTVNNIITAQTYHFSPTAGAGTASTAKTIASNCKTYCGDMATYTMPVGTACVCSRDNPKCPAGDPTCQHREEGIIDRATNWIFYLGLILAPLFILIGAFMIMVGGGSSKKGKNAEGIEGIFNPTVGGGKKMITYAVIGLVLALCTRLIYHVIRFLIGQ